MTVTASGAERASRLVDYDPRQDAASQQARPPTLQERCLGWAFATGLKTLSATWRVRYQGLDIVNDLDRLDQRYILATWHRDYVALFRMFRERSVLAVTNQSHRGQVIANICHRSRMRTVQVRRTGTKHMLDSLNQISKDQHAIAVTVDGPLGPAFQVKRVVVHLAARLQCPIVPVSVAIGRQYVCKDRWDRLGIPCPLTTVGIVLGSPIEVSGDKSRIDRRAIAADVKAAIESGEHAARDLVS